MVQSQQKHFSIDHLIQLFSNKKSKASKKYIEELKNINQQVENIIQKTLECILCRKIFPTCTTFFYALVFYRDLLISAEIDYFDDEDFFPAKIHDAVASLCRYNKQQPVLKKKGELFFINDCKPAEAAQQENAKALGGSIIIMAAQIIQNMATLYPQDYHKGTKSHFAKHYEKLLSEKFPFQVQKQGNYFKQEERKLFKVNYKHFLKKLEEDDDGSQQKSQKEKAKPKNVPSNPPAPAIVKTSPNGKKEEIKKPITAKEPQKKPIIAKEPQKKTQNKNETENINYSRYDTYLQPDLQPVCEEEKEAIRHYQKSCSKASLKKSQLKQSLLSQVRSRKSSPKKQIANITHYTTPVRSYPKQEKVFFSNAPSSRYQAQRDVFDRPAESAVYQSFYSKRTDEHSNRKSQASSQARSMVPGRIASTGKMEHQPGYGHYPYNFTRTPSTVKSNRRSLPKTQKNYSRQFLNENAVMNKLSASQHEYANVLFDHSPKKLFSNSSNIQRNLSYWKTQKQGSKGPSHMGMKIYSLVQVLGKLNFAQSTIPVIPEYFEPVSLHMRDLRHAALEIHPHTDSGQIFFNNHIIEARLLKPSKHSFVLSLHNISRCQVGVKSVDQSKSRFCRFLKIENQNLSHFCETKISPDCYLDIKFKFMIYDLNFRFLQFVVSIDGQLVPLLLPITLLDQCQIIKQISLENVNQYHYQSGKIMKTQPFFMQAKMIPSFMTQQLRPQYLEYSNSSSSYSLQQSRLTNSSQKISKLSELYMRQKHRNKIRKIVAQCSILMHHEDSLQAPFKLDLFIEKQGQRFRVNAIFNQKSHFEGADFAKVMLQLMAFLLVQQ